MHLRWECEKVTKLLAFARAVELAELTKPTPQMQYRVRTLN